MQRTPLNPWPWSLNFGFNQGEVIEGGTRLVSLAGQTSVDGDGQPQHPNDMRAQMVLALDNLEAVLKSADLGLDSVIHVRVYTTDIDQTMQHYALLGSRFGPLGVAPPMTLLGVTRLALPELSFEIEATAAS